MGPRQNAARSPSVSAPTESDRLLARAGEAGVLQAMRRGPWGCPPAALPRSRHGTVIGWTCRGRFPLTRTTAGHWAVERGHRMTEPRHTIPSGADIRPPPPAPAIALTPFLLPHEQGDAHSLESFCPWRASAGCPCPGLEASRTIHRAWFYHDRVAGTGPAAVRFRGVRR